MSAHTPGPWAFSRWDQYGDTRFYIAQADGAPYTPNFSDAATLIAETVSIERVAIQKANARLISAAPQLLEALLNLRALVKGECPSLLDEDSGGNSGLDMEIDEAIAKAQQGGSK